MPRPAAESLNNHEAGADAYREFSAYINRITANGEGFVEGFKREHRTLQQRAAVAFLKCFEVLAEKYDAGDYDDRNKAACQRARVIIDALDREGLTLEMPFI